MDNNGEFNGKGNGELYENCMKTVVIAPYYGTNKAAVYLHLWCPYTRG